MKTRKEQIDEMANIIKADYKQWLDITGVFPEGSSYYFECLGGGEDCAELLYNAGYGDVSEYEAEREMLGSQIKVLKQRLNNKYVEIEKLKAENCELTKKLEARLTCDFVKTAQKHAQIDILNKAKKCSYCDNDFLDGKWHRYVFVDDIDKLIKELQNGKDKG